MELIITQLSTGHVQIRGKGPCNWAQPAHFPCSDEDLEGSTFHEAGDEFRNSLRTLRDAMDGGEPKP